MNRLPCYDRATRRSELVGFASLGFAGVLIVALAIAQMTKFVASSARIAAALAGRTEPLAVASQPEHSRPVGAGENPLEAEALNEVATVPGPP